jgi:2-(1,2-epoxy-1,2-dihydrophenyl)acetyl-CoA isomerase
MAGAGEHFMAGGDVMGFKETFAKPSHERRAEFEARIGSVAPLFRQIARMPQPIVARVQGAVAGAAVGFVAGSDFAICSQNAIFIVAHVNIGASPDGSTSYYLPRAVGVRKAKELAMLGERLGAQDALEFGLVNRVVPDAELDTAVATLVDKIVAAPATSVRRIKLLIDRSLAQYARCAAAARGRIFCRVRGHRRLRRGRQRVRAEAQARFQSRRLTPGTEARTRTWFSTAYA